MKRRAHRGAPPRSGSLDQKRETKPVCDNTEEPLHRALHGPFKNLHYHMVNKHGVLCPTPWECMKVKVDDKD